MKKELIYILIALVVAYILLRKRYKNAAKIDKSITDPNSTDQTDATQRVRTHLPCPTECGTNDKIDPSNDSFTVASRPIITTHKPEVR